MRVPARALHAPNLAPCAAIIALVLLAVSQAFTQTELQPPPTFKSQGHVLDLLMVVRTKQIALNEFSPVAWIYEVCLRRDAVNGKACPAGSKTASEYGGMRLQLEPGDHLKIRLVNQLPPSPPDAIHVSGEMAEMLKANPTNLHTHGLITEPRRATASDPTYGDYVYVLAYPKGKLPEMQHPGLDYSDKPVDYDIYIPRNHPSGLFWIHPHAHGLALNQVTYGMAGIITIGSIDDYLHDRAHGRGMVRQHNVRYLTLKDMQVLADSTVLSQQDSEFCSEGPSADEPKRNGFCPGIEYSDDTGVHDYTGGKWFFTVNGQVFPKISVSHGTGEVWRITNTSGSRSYDLVLANDQNGTPLQFQVLAVDGVSIDDDASPQVMAQRLKGRVTPQPCLWGAPGHAVCANEVRMMPSSRVEIWVSSRQAEFARSATLLTRAYETGPDGDDWPSIRLAQVVFRQGGGTVTDTVSVSENAETLLRSGGLLASEVRISGGHHPDEVPLSKAQDVENKLSGESARSLTEHLYALSAPSDLPSPPCAALPPGHKRRIFFGVPSSDPDGFGLGYEEIDEHGNPIPSTFQDLIEFDHSFINVCLPLGEGDRPVREGWELVNVSAEDHNFHIHQTKFEVVRAGEGDSETGALVDNVPVPHGSNGCDGSIDSWRSGACQVQPVEVAIPFSEVGDFVYHCHILEHEDGGMMAHIRVVPHE